MIFTFDIADFSVVWGILTTKDVIDLMVYKGIPPIRNRTKISIVGPYWNIGNVTQINF